jgi:four helix bundle protein
MSQSVLQEQSYAFAVRIVRLSEYLNNEKREFVLSKKVLDSGTAIGALIEEARQGDGRADFGQKLGLAAKEAFKTNYWIRLLRDTSFITYSEAESLLTDCVSLQKMLVASRKKVKSDL